MSKIIKDLYHQWIADADAMPPLNDDDAFFYVDKTTEEQIAYNYETHKMALGLFYKQVDLNKKLMEEILRLSKEIEVLRNKKR